LLPGGAIQFPGGSFFSRCGSAPFHGALKNPDYTHLPIPAKRFDVKRIERSRNLSAIA